MKRRILSFALALILTFALVPVSANAPQVGDKLGDVLHTDIKAYIDGNQIPSFNIDGNTYIIAEDLKNYGFNTVWNGADRTLKITQNEKKAITPLTVAEGGVEKVGSAAFPYVYTDIRTFVEDKEVTSYNINGRTVIRIDDLEVYGKSAWNSAARTISLRLESQNYIAIIDGKKISMEEYQLVILLDALDGGSSNPVQSALDSLISFAALDKMAKDKNIVMTRDEKNYVKSCVELITDYLGYIGVTMPKVSKERLEFIVGNTIVLYEMQYRLIDAVAAEKGFKVDEAQFAAELETYRQNDKLLKYIIVETEEKLEEVKEVLASGEMSLDDVIWEYSINYAGTPPIEKVTFSDLIQMGFTEKELDGIMDLNASEFSNEVAIGDGSAFVIFIAATDAETEEDFREKYEFQQKLHLFEEEYNMYKSDMKIEINEKAYNAFDLNEFWKSISP